MVIIDTFQDVQKFAGSLVAYKRNEFDEDLVEGFTEKYGTISDDITSVKDDQGNIILTGFMITYFSIKNCYGASVMSDFWLKGTSLEMRMATPSEVRKLHRAVHLGYADHLDKAYVGANPLNWKKLMQYAQAHFASPVLFLLGYFDPNSLISLLPKDVIKFVCNSIEQW